MCIGVRDIDSFGDQSAKTKNSQHLVIGDLGQYLVCNSYGKMGYKHFDHNI